MMKLLALCFLMISPLSAFEWEPKTHEGRDYLSLEQVAEFYKLTDSGTGRLHTATLTLEFVAGESKAHMNKVPCNLRFPVLDLESKLFLSNFDTTQLLDPILRPNKLEGSNSIQTIVIDPTHGGDDPGTVYPDGKESDLTLAQARILRDELISKGFKVVMTRDEDSTLSLAERIEIANKHSDSIFIRIDYSEPTAPRGIQTFALVLPETSKDSTRSKFSLALTCSTHWSLTAKLQQQGNSIENLGLGYTPSDDFKDLKGRGIAIVLGNPTHAGDLAVLEGKNSRQSIAQAVSGSLMIAVKATKAK